MSQYRSILYTPTLFLTLFCITSGLRGDNIVGRDAVNTNENNLNNYTKVENNINFTQLVKLLSKVSSKAIVKASANICIEIKNAITQLMRNAVSQIVQTTVQTGHDAYRSATTNAHTFLSEYKWRLIGTAALGLYGYLLYQIITIRVYFSQHERWFNWNEFLSLDALCTRPQDDLGIDLVKEIQRRYTSISAPTDFVTPLIRFLQEIDAEEKTLELYLKLGTWIERLRLCTITGYSSQLRTQCEEWRRRVGYLRSTFMRWMADYKLEHNRATLSMIDNRFFVLQAIARLNRNSST